MIFYNGDEGEESIMAKQNLNGKHLGYEICSGVILSRIYVLTTAQCTETPRV